MQGNRIKGSQNPGLPVDAATQGQKTLNLETGQNISKIEATLITYPQIPVGKTAGLPAQVPDGGPGRVRFLRAVPQRGIDGAPNHGHLRRSGSLTINFCILFIIQISLDDDINK